MVKSEFTLKVFAGPSHSRLNIQHASTIIIETAEDAVKPPTPLPLKPQLILLIEDMKCNFRQKKK